MLSTSIDGSSFVTTPESKELSAVALPGFRNVAEATAAILGLIHDLVGLRVCVITRVDAETKTLTVVDVLDKVGVGIARGMVVPLDALPCDYVVRTATPLREYRLDQHPLFRNLSLRASLGLRSYVGVPLKRSDGTVWGTLAATDTIARETTEQHLQTLTVLARLVVLEYEREEQRRALAAHAQMLAEQLAITNALEQERIRTVRLQAVLEAAAAVSHEINNPLTVLQLRLGRLAKEPPNDPRVADDLESAREAADEIQQVTVHLRSVVQPVSTQYLRDRTQMLDLAASTKSGSRSNVDT